MTDTFNQVSAGAHEKAQRQSLAFEKQTEGLRRLIWLYVILWLIEGGLRRWFLPGLATPLLLVRDPLVVVIYLLAASKNLFPTNGFIVSGTVLALLTFVNAMVLGHGNLLVALYGMRCDFLHVPLIFLMARVLKQKDLIAVAKAAMWVVIPYSALLVLQFYSPQDAWVNRGVGGSLEGAGFSGALDRFRPPGTFSFITGPAELYPLFTACWFVLAIACRIPPWHMILAGTAILIAIPVSVSRSLFLSVAVVGAVGFVALFIGKKVSTQTILKVVLTLIILAALAARMPAFKDGMTAFEARWEAATTDNGGFQEAIVDRVLNDLFGSFGEVNVTGLGTGYSTNVGQKLLTQEVGFGASEAEWGRLLFDNGFILGGLLVVYRVALTGWIVLASIRAWQRRSPQALIFVSSAFFLLLEGQWGQASTLGAAIIAGGLALAATGDPGTGQSKMRAKRIKPRANKIGADPTNVTS